MAAILIVDGGKKLEFDRCFSDGGKDAVFMMAGGQKVLMEKGQPAKITIYQKGNDLFTLDGKPAGQKVLQPYLDDPDTAPETKELFEEFLERLSVNGRIRNRLDKIRSSKAEAPREQLFRPEDAGLSSESPERV